MKKEKLVFVGIMRVGGLDMIEQVHVSTSLRGLCRLMGLPKVYEILAKGLKRKGGITEFDTRSKYGDNVHHWGVWRVELDTIWGRGDKEIGKRSGGFRGYKREDGLLGGVPQDGAEKTGGKRRMGFDEVVNTWKEGDPE